MPSPRPTGLWCHVVFWMSGWVAMFKSTAQTNSLLRSRFFLTLSSLSWSLKGNKVCEILQESVKTFQTYSNSTKHLGERHFFKLQIFTLSFVTVFLTLHLRGLHLRHAFKLRYSPPHAAWGISPCMFRWHGSSASNPKDSMYGIFTYFYHKKHSHM